MERKLLGCVGVDSGQLLVIDPSYIKSQWENIGSLLGVEFWGEANEDISSLLKDKGYKVKPGKGHASLIETTDKGEADKIRKEIYKSAGRLNKRIVSSFKTTSTYDTIADLTLGEEQAGQLNYQMGHEGLGVAFTSGLGDGVYNVYGTYQDIEGWGNRITKVEIELIPDEYLNKDQDDSHSSLEDQIKKQDELINKLYSISLWSARRLSTEQHAKYLYDEIERATGKNVDRDWKGKQV